MGATTLIENNKTISLKDLVDLIWGYSLFLFIASVIGGLAAWSYTFFFITPQFESKATMIVNSRAEQNVTITYDQINSARNLVNTYAVILMSDTVINQVIRNLQNKGYYSIKNIEPIEMMKKIEISQVGTTQIMSITARDPDRILAADIVNEILAIAPNFLVMTVKAGSVEIVSPPSVTDKPVTPDVLKNTLIGSLFGGIISFCIIVFREFLDNTVKSDNDIRNLIGLPVLGVIPLVENATIYLQGEKKKNAYDG
jgi:capsular polysaccharide biosynthesis protein